jgi:hypothetical protein
LLRFLDRLNKKPYQISIYKMICETENKQKTIKPKPFFQKLKP